MDRFCSFCGTQHTSVTYPKKCEHCRQLTWKNPLPVAVLLQPVSDPQTNRKGILLGRRSIRPHIGEWALIGGHVDPEDADIFDAALREFEEETGIELYSAIHRPSLTLHSSFADGHYLLIFVENSLPIPLKKLDEFVVNSECSEIRVAWQPEELCFHSHTNALASWFNSNAS
jgi:8-oxo-dGTP diphosphatase